MFLHFIDIFSYFLCHDERSNILMLRKEDDHFIAGNLDAHIAADSRICDYDANK